MKPDQHTDAGVLTKKALLIALVGLISVLITVMWPLIISSVSTGVSIERVEYFHGKTRVWVRLGRCPFVVESIYVRDDAMSILVNQKELRPPIDFIDVPGNLTGKQLRLHGYYLCWP